MIRRLVFASLLIASASLATAAELPPGKWWRRPEIVQQLALTEDQRAKLDAAFLTNANALIDLRAEVEKQNIALRGELDRPVLNRSNIQRIAGRLTEARGRLFSQELMMMVDMRDVLTDEQWTRMRNRLNEEPRLRNRR